MKINFAKVQKKCDIFRFIGCLNLVYLRELTNLSRQPAIASQFSAVGTEQLDSCYVCFVPVELNYGINIGYKYIVPTALKTFIFNILL